MSHDFYQRVAAWYDLEFDDFDDDVDLYLGYAHLIGSPILELGCGTGRLLAPLAEAGFEVVGVDQSPAMIDAARQRLSAGDLDVELHVDDFRQLQSVAGRRFQIIFCAINSFLHLTTREDQATTLRTVRDLLDHNGILILDVFHPTPALLSQMDDRLTADGGWDLTDGGRIDRLSHRRVTLAEQWIDTTLYFDKSAPDGTLTRSVLNYGVRYIHRFEMEALLDHAGLAIEGVYGSYALDPLEDSSPIMLFVAHRR